MGDNDRSLGIMLIFIIAFLGTFFALILIVPSGFLYGGKTYSQYEIPSYFTKEDIENIKHFKNDTITRDGLIWVDFNPDANFKFEIPWYGVILGDYLSIGHITWEWWIFNTGHYMTIEDMTTMSYSGLTRIYKADLISHWNNDFNVSRFRPVRCEHITITVWFTDYNISRNDISEAFDDGTLNIGIGFGFSDYETTLNAWEIIGRLLSFQSPEIFGATGSIALALNLIIAMPIYVSIGFLVYILILKAIPFVGG